MVEKTFSMLSAAITLSLIVYSFICVALYFSTWFSFQKGQIWLKNLVYSNFFARKMCNGIVQFTLISLTTLYYITIDVWGDSLPFFTKNAEAHKYVYFTLMPLNAIALFFAAASATFERSTKNYVSLLEDFVKLTSNHVEQKIIKLRDDTRRITKSGDNLKTITHTPMTVHQLLVDTERLLQKHYNLDDEKIIVTIVRLDPYSKQWKYTHWHRADAPPIDAARLMRSDLSSTEHSAYINDVTELYVDKNDAYDRGLYLKNRHDSKPLVGSIFCFPVFSILPSYSKDSDVLVDTHIISINMYDNMFCDPHDNQQIADVKKVFNEICRQIELELKLGAIVAWKANATPPGAPENESID